MTKPENIVLIYPPIRIIGRKIGALPFIVSVSIVGSVIGEVRTIFASFFLKNLSSGLLKQYFHVKKDYLGI